MTSLFVFTDVIEELDRNTAQTAMSGTLRAPLFGKADLSRALPSRSKHLTLCDLNETHIVTKQEAEIDSAFAIGAIYTQY